MSNRGHSRGDLTRAARRAPSPSWRVTDRASTTVPRPCVADAPQRRESPGWSRSRAPTPSATQLQTPVRRERIPGGTALDGLDQRVTAGSAGLGWRDLIYPPHQDRPWAKQRLDVTNSGCASASAQSSRARFLSRSSTSKVGSARPRSLRRSGQLSPTCATTGSSPSTSMVAICPSGMVAGADSIWSTSSGTIRSRGISMCARIHT